MDRDGTVLPDGQHHLLVYKADDPVRLKEPSASYLTLPHATKQVNFVATAASASQAAASLVMSAVPGVPFQRNARESVTISFYLCSTKLTQNGKKSILLLLDYSPDFSKYSQSAVIAQVALSPGKNN